MLKRKYMLALLLALLLCGCTTEEAEPTPTPSPRVISQEEMWRSIQMEETPGSSCFSCVGYDRESETLRVEFRENGYQYVYLDVPYDEWDDFISASSLGTYYNKFIKPYYEYERIE